MDQHVKRMETVKNHTQEPTVIGATAITGRISTQNASILVSLLTQMPTLAHLVLMVPSFMMVNVFLNAHKAKLLTRTLTHALMDETTAARPVLLFPQFLIAWNDWYPLALLIVQIACQKVIT